jgi:hypothetical protein
MKKTNEESKTANAYTFPEYSLTIEAETLEEAQEKLQTLLSTKK